MWIFWFAEAGKNANDILAGEIGRGTKGGTKRQLVQCLTSLSLASLTTSLLLASLLASLLATLIASLLATLFASLIVEAEFYTQR